MNYSLVMAIIWFVFGVGWFIAAWTTGGKLPVIHLGQVDVSPAWLALLLGVYNVVRWRMRPRRRTQDALHDALEARRRMHHSEEHPPGPPDPNFNFTDAPPSTNEPPPTS